MDTMSIDPETEFRRRLASEIQAWREEGLIDEALAQALLARQGARLARFLAALRLGLLITAVAVIGALAMGAGVLLFIAANWKAGEDSPAYLKAGLLFGGIGLAYYTGYLLQFRFAVQERVGAAIILLGAILFQAAIFLLEQIYNMPVNSPIGLLLGAAGVLPLAYLTGSRFVLFLGLVDLAAWVGWQVGSQYPHAPESIALPLTLLLLGIAFYSCGHLQARWPPMAAFAGIYIALGLLLTLGATFPLTFGDFWEEFRCDHHSYVNNVSRCVERDFSAYNPAVGLLIVLALAAAATLAAALLRGLRSSAMRAESALLLAFLAMVAVAAIWPWLPLAVPFNLLFFAAALGCISRGYMQADNKFIYLGLAAIAIGLIARYAEMSWDLLPRSGFFLFGGLLLLLMAAIMERARRGMLTRPGDD